MVFLLQHFSQHHNSCRGNCNSLHLHQDGNDGNGDQGSDSTSFGRNSHCEYLWMSREIPEKAESRVTQVPSFSNWRKRYTTCWDGKTRKGLTLGLVHGAKISVFRLLDLGYLVESSWIWEFEVETKWRWIWHHTEDLYIQSCFFP